ncbi:hypothetical protein HanIR_Chr05g0248321 [Helianthus annuus]|nr:hypothetical protein HanIR_Chr05g0248321 [Helianthus annuus]
MLQKKYVTKNKKLILQNIKSTPVTHPPENSSAAPPTHLHKPTTNADAVKR